jgi:hypothetical protein
VDDRIVMNHHYAVAGRMNIQLNAFGAELDGPLERG